MGASLTRVASLHSTLLGSTVAQDESSAGALLRFINAILSADVALISLRGTVTLPVSAVVCR